jgi:hypothetical protein
LTASCLLIAIITLATAQGRRHSVTIPLSDKPRQVLELAGHTTTGIDQGREVDTIIQKLLDDRLERDNAFRRRDRTKSSQWMGRCHGVESKKASCVDGSVHPVCS